MVSEWKLCLYMSKEENYCAYSIIVADHALYFALHHRIFFGV
jgi:hypothetical protein